MNIDSKYIAERNCGIDCPQPWEFLVERIIKVVADDQTRYLPLKTPTEKASYAPSDRDLYDFKLVQVKEKFAALRVYYDVTVVEQDWDKFDKELSLKIIQGQIKELRGYVEATEWFSTKICEVTGERGEVFHRGGWLKTLSPAKAAELGYEKA